MKPISFTNWRKSSRSSGGANCVEVAFAPNGTVGIRDSKDPHGPVLALSASRWREFIDGIRTNRFDINSTPDSCVGSTSRVPVLIGAGSLLQQPSPQ